jgi:hypothetical protein
LAERLEWARKHGVRPPQFAIAEAERAGFDTSWLADCAASKRPCCVADSKCGSSKDCQRQFADDPPADTRTCCAKKAPPKVEHRTRDHVVAWQAMKCGGQSLKWLAAVPMRHESPLEFSHQLPLVAWLGPAASERAECASSAPVPPPPETA